jgi:hypothetical protein
MVQTSCDSLPGASEVAAAARSLPDSWNTLIGSRSVCPLGLISLAVLPDLRYILMAL